MNKKITVLGGLLMAVVMTAYSVSGTYAKYTSTFTGSDSARVAKWAFKIGDITNTSAAGAGTTFSFDLFKTINDTDGSKETDVAAPNTTDTTNNISGLIAPGTQGSFDIKLQNLSEVTAMYGIKYKVTNTAGIPVEFCTVTATETCADTSTAWKASIDEVVADKTNTNLAMNAGSDTTTTVKWRWAFERGADDTEKNAADVVDTTLGIDGTATLKVDATVVVTQVD